MQSILAFTLLLAQGPAGPAPLCESIAEAALSAERHRVESQFWFDVAHALNGPSADSRAALRDAWSARRDGLLLAERQHLARGVVCAALGHAPWRPDLRPADFSADVTALYFPLPVGSTMIYERASAAGFEHIEVSARDTVARIGGFPCRTVNTVEYVDGALVEHTVEWFGQHADGSVWYFGESALKFEDGILVSMEGSWRAGSDGAQPGVQMAVQQATGSVLRREFLMGTAEDVSRVVGTDLTVQVPAGTFDGCVAIEESSPLEPDDIATKYYAPGVGLVLEVDAADGSRLELMRVE